MKKLSDVIVISVLLMLLFSSSAFAATIDFTNMGVFSGPSLTEGDVTVTGSANVTHDNAGLGIAGGSNQFLIDSSSFGDESMSFSFANPVTDVVVHYSSTNTNSGDPFDVKAEFEGFDENAVSLGIMTVTMLQATTSIDISALFGLSDLSGFDITVIQDGMGISGIEYQLVPIPAAVWLFGSALGLLGWIRRNKNKGSNRI